jgi:hypothetical protein
MRVPYIGIHIKTINTFFHEIGHALMALVFNGEIYHIKLNINNSGEALTATKGWFAKFFVSISGYLFPLALSIIILVCIKYKHPMWGFYGLFILSICAAIMWIRNAYGYLWSLVFVTIFALLMYAKKLAFVKLFLAFNIAALLTENVAACITLIKLASKNPKQAGDAYSLKQYTFIPTIMWALFFLLMSCIAIIISLFYSNTLVFL